MVVIATLTSKGQVTLPVAVRRALALEQGDKLMFTVRGKSVVIEKTFDFLGLAGSVTVPMDRRSALWPSIVETTWQARGAA